MSLYWELIACFVAVTVLSLWVGWILNKSTSSKHLNHAEASWEKRYIAMEDTALIDTENLEEQLQELAGETRTLKATNRVLNDTIKKNDIALQKARAEAIELNRQHAETQERLQRIIQQKDRELASHGSRSLSGSKNDVRSGSTFTAPITGSIAGVDGNDIDSIIDEFEDTIPASASSGQDTEFEATIAFNQDSEIDAAATVAINPMDVMESMDSTVQMTASEFIHQRDNTAKSLEDAADNTEFDDFVDETADLSARYMDDIEESTLALDEDSLEFAKRPFPVSNVD